jgi:hypothetical protein
MKQGVDIDIVSGKPREVVKGANAAEKQTRDENILKNQAEFLGLSGSPDGQKLIALIQDQLNRRIDELVVADPKAQAFVQILSDMGIKEGLAKKAAAKLVAMKVGVDAQ